MTDAREAQLLAIIVDLAQTVNRLTARTQTGAGGGYYGEGVGGSPRTGVGAVGAPGSGAAGVIAVGGGAGGGGGGGGSAQFTMTAAVHKFPQHDPNFPDVNAIGDERETTDGEAA